MDSETLAISRNSHRRGAAAAYLRVDHPDIEDFLEIRRPTGGDMDRKCLNINNGVVITDEFMRAVEENRTYKLIDPHYNTVTKELSAVEIWRKILTIRAETGEPYLLFIDTVNKAIPPHHKEKGLVVRQSNLCTEIVLPTTDDRTAVCCLGNLNMETFDEWKDQVEQITYDCVKALDNNLDSFCEMADPVEYKKARTSFMTHHSGIKTPAGVHTARETPACAGGEGEDHAGIFLRFLRHQSCTSRTRRTGILPASLHCETAARVTPRALRRSSVSRKTVGMRSSTFMARGCVTRPAVSSVLSVPENNL
jgi:hypothetical protein